MTDIVYTDQTAFTTMRNHVLSMTERCFSNDENSCLYNGETKDGQDNHCAVGALLVGIELDHAENTGGIQYIIDKNPEAKERIGGCNVNLLKECQAVHDDTDNWESNSLFYRSKAFDEIAEKHDLKVEESPNA